MECAMEWLGPEDIATTALTSSTMAAAALKETSRRLEDAAQGMEAFPVTVIDDYSSYPYFEYTPVSVTARRSKLAFRWGSSSPNASENARRSFEAIGSFAADGCSCVVKCQVSSPQDSRTSGKRLKCGEEEAACSSSPSCSCGKTVLGDPAYDSDSRLWCLRQEGSRAVEEELPMIYECGPACSCDMTCIHRTSQRGLSVKVQVVRHPKKGWSLYAAEDIKRGAFICEYAGELLTTKEARRRHQIYDEEEDRNASALLVIREHLPSRRQTCLRFNIDATNVGNVARFMNHSCDGGNLLSCLVRSAGCCLPRLAFFAKEQIESGTELTFSYGSNNNVEEQNGHVRKPCFCGTLQCRGKLPFEIV